MQQNIHILGVHLYPLTEQSPQCGYVATAWHDLYYIILIEYSSIVNISGVTDHFYSNLRIIIAI